MKTLDLIEQAVELIGDGMVPRIGFVDFVQKFAGIGNKANANRAALAYSIVAIDWHAEKLGLFELGSMKSLNALILEKKLKVTDLERLPDTPQQVFRVVEPSLRELTRFDSRHGSGNKAVQEGTMYSKLSAIEKAVLARQRALSRGELEQWYAQFQSAPKLVTHGLGIAMLGKPDTGPSKQGNNTLSRVLGGTLKTMVPPGGKIDVVPKGVDYTGINGFRVNLPDGQWIDFHVGGP